MKDIKQPVPTKDVLRLVSFGVVITTMFGVGYDASFEHTHLWAMLGVIVGLFIVLVSFWGDSY